MWTSSRSGSPTRDISLKRLHQECFDAQHHRDKRESISQDSRDVEQLEGYADLKAYAIWPAEQLDDQDDLPHQRKAGTRGGTEIGRKLRQYHVAQPLPRAHAKHSGHFIEIAVQSAHSLPHGDRREWQFVEHDGR